VWNLTYTSHIYTDLKISAQHGETYSLPKWSMLFLLDHDAATISFASMCLSATEYLKHSIQQ
jgi:hypothetical protein